MRTIIDLLQSGREAAAVMEILEREEHPHKEALRTAGRNDPCPCGSGRKVKHCHGAPSRAEAARPLPDQLGAPRPPVTERGKRAAAAREDRNI